MAEVSVQHTTQAIIPEKFTYPFRYVPHPEIVAAAERLIAKISGREDLKDLFSEGKMMGVLLTDAGFLYSFSGLAGGKSMVDGFVPPIFDYAEKGSYYRKREAEISAMQSGEDKRKASEELQRYLFDNYVVLNALGERKSITEIFSDRGLVPPGGTGDCAAPKLLQYAYLHSLKPIAMGEFWYGESHSSEIREEGRFYPSCTGKCGPLLTFMMQGLDVEPNPLDKEYCGREPEIVYEDESIIVADKPAGMLAVPGRNGVKSLLDYLKERYGGEVYSCHRLDMDTSGLIVYAKNMESKVKIERQFAAREVVKTYWARLCAKRGAFRHPDRGRIELPLRLDYDDRPRQVVDFKNGKPAITEYEVIEKLPNGEVEILFHPLTGRSHQLRVHAAHKLGLSHPIKGDSLYGNPSKENLYLRAVSLELTHPINGKRMTFKTQ